METFNLDKNSNETFLWFLNTVPQFMIQHLEGRIGMKHVLGLGLQEFQNAWPKPIYILKEY